MPDEAHAGRGLELSLRGFIAIAHTRPRSPNRQIAVTSASSSKASMALRALREQDLRLFEIFPFRA
jgi:hypothetical protein